MYFPWPPFVHACSRLLPELKSIMANWLLVTIPKWEKCWLFGIHLYKAWKISRIPMWANLVSYFKSPKTCLSKTIYCRALNVSLVGFNHNFLYTLLLVILGWTHWWNLEQIDLCLFCMWKRILHHFSFSSVSSPSHVETAHQRWLMIDLIHPLKAWHDFFFAAAAKFFLILLQKCQISNWCIVSFPFSLLCFLSFECLLSVVIWSTVTPFVLKNLSPFMNPTFSILLEFCPLSLWVMVIAAILLVIWSMKEYVKYLTLCLGLSHLLSPLRWHEPCSFKWFNIELFSLQYLS